MKNIHEIIRLAQVAFDSAYDTYRKNTGHGATAVQTLETLDRIYDVLSALDPDTYPQYPQWLDGRSQRATRVPHYDKQIKGGI